MVAITLFKVKITDFGTNCKPICDMLLIIFIHHTMVEKKQNKQNNLTKS